MYQTILIPVDGSKRAEKIFSHVENLAKIHEAKTVLLKVEEEPIMLERDEVIEIEKYLKEYERRIGISATYLETLKVKFREKGIHAVTRLVYGSVVKAILAVAAETGADLIALATHGLSGLPHVSYGSVAAGLLQTADIPVLLIRSANGEKEEIL